jgi:NADH:ubiquinone oxidoreductase subunit 3 (subunit A)
MLLTGDFISRGVNVLVEKFKPRKKEKYSAKKTLKKTAETTDNMLFAIMAMLVLIFEVILIVFLILRTVKEVKPGADRNIRLILICFIPELYALAYFFLPSKKSAYSYS